MLFGTVAGLFLGILICLAAEVLTSCVECTCRCFATLRIPVLVIPASLLITDYVQTAQKPCITLILVSQAGAVAEVMLVAT